MATVTYPTTLDLDGPWLLSRDDLIALDTLLDSEWHKLTAWREEELNKTILLTISDNEAKIEHYSKDSDPKQRSEYIERLRETFPTDAAVIRPQILETFKFQSFSRQLTLLCNDGATIIVPEGKFINIIKDLTHQNIVANSFDLQLECLNITAKVELRSKRNALAVSVRPEGLSESQCLFQSIREWALERKPPKLLTRWQDGLLATLAFPVCVMTFFILLSINTVGVHTPRAIALDLLHRGLKPGDELKALELILKIQANYSEGSVALAPAFWYSILGMGVIFAGLLYRPGSLLGVGRGDKKLNNRKRKLLILKYLTGLIVTGITLPYIYDHLKPYLPGIS